MTERERWIEERKIATLWDKQAAILARFDITETLRDAMAFADAEWRKSLKEAGWKEKVEGGRPSAAELSGDESPDSGLRTPSTPKADAHREAGGIWPDIIPPQRFENPDPGWQDAKAVDLRLLWKIGRACGYAIGVHGSLKKDMDLIAAPWTDEAVGNAELVEKLCAEIPATMVNGPERKPHGRYAVTLQIDGYYKSLDISIMPRTTPPPTPASEKETR